LNKLGMTASAIARRLGVSDKTVRRSLVRLLRSAGFEVETFASAEDFLSAPHPDRPSCLVLDLRMPGVGGLDLQHRLAENASTPPSSSSPATAPCRRACGR